MCCCIPHEHVESQRGRYKDFNGKNLFRVTMLAAPVESCKALCCFIGQCNPITAGCTQFFLRRRALQGDMSQYICCQGYNNGCCCFKPGRLCESSCPCLCLCIESHFCCPVMYTRYHVMDMNQLQNDPCDNRLIWCNNCCQCASCICDILSLIIGELADYARIVDFVSDIMFCCVSGCMTSQVVVELDFQETNPANKRKKSNFNKINPV